MNLEYTEGKKMQIISTLDVPIKEQKKSSMDQAPAVDIEQFGIH